jgi:hypothetical protein
LAGALVFLLVAGIGTGPPRYADPRRGRATRRRWETALALGSGFVSRAFEYGRNVPLSAAHLRDVGVVSWRGPAEPVALPAGTYEARVWFAGAAAREGENRRGLSAERGCSESSPARCRIRRRFPSSCRRMRPVSWSSCVNPKWAERVMNTEIVPHDVLPLSARDGHTVRAVDSVGDSTNGYIVYVDSTTFPEGRCGSGRAAAISRQCLVAPAVRPDLVVTLFPGPLSGDVRLSVAGKPSQVHVEANQIRAVRNRSARGVRLVAVEIQAPGQFRPNDV